MTVVDVFDGRERAFVEHARYEAFAPQIPDGSVSLLVLDPPYFRVVDEDWDKQWKTEADYLAWLRDVISESARVLAKNGSLYLFASPAMAARVECTVAQEFNVLNHITWVKQTPRYMQNDDAAQRIFFPQTERVIFAEHVAERNVPTPASNGLPFMYWIAKVRGDAGLNKGQLSAAIGRTLKSDPTRGTVLVHQWEVGACAPTFEDFASIGRVCGVDAARDLYDTMRAEHDAARVLYESNRRPFNVETNVETTDVWTYASPAPDASRHVCEKPIAMLHEIIECSTRTNDVVCEFFGGSFRMAEVALSRGRRYIGCDADEHWASVGKARVSAALNGTIAPVPGRKPRERNVNQGDLFAVKKTG